MKLFGVSTFMVLAVVPVLSTWAEAPSTEYTVEGNFANAATLGELSAGPDYSRSAQVFDGSDRVGVYLYTKREQPKQISMGSSADVIYEFDSNQNVLKKVLSLPTQYKIVKWDNASSGAVIYYCAGSEYSDPNLYRFEVLTGQTTVVPGTCAKKAIEVGYSQYFYFEHVDGFNYRMYRTEGLPIYSNLKPSMGGPTAESMPLVSDHFVSSPNHRYVAVPHYERPGLNSTSAYVYDLKENTAELFSNLSVISRGAVLCDDGQQGLRSGNYQTQTEGLSYERFDLKSGATVLEYLYDPSLLAGASSPNKFWSARVSSDAKLLVLESSHDALLERPNGRLLRSDVAVFDYQNGKHLREFRNATISGSLGSDRVLVNSWADRELKVLDYSKGELKITHTFKFPVEAGLTEIQAQAWGTNLMLSYRGKVWFYRLL